MYNDESELQAIRAELAEIKAYVRKFGLVLCVCAILPYFFWFIGFLFYSYFISKLLEQFAKLPVPSI